MMSEMKIEDIPQEIIEVLGLRAVILLIGLQNAELAQNSVEVFFFGGQICIFCYKTGLLPRVFTCGSIPDEFQPFIWNLSLEWWNTTATKNEQNAIIAASRAGKEPDLVLRYLEPATRIPECVAPEFRPN